MRFNGWISCKSFVLRCKSMFWGGQILGSYKWLLHIKGRVHNFGINISVMQFSPWHLLICSSSLTLINPPHVESAQCLFDWLQFWKDSPQDIHILRTLVYQLQFRVLNWLQLRLTLCHFHSFPICSTVVLGPSQKYRLDYC